MCLSCCSACATCSPHKGCTSPTSTLLSLPPARVSTDTCTAKYIQCTHSLWKELKLVQYDGQASLQAQQLSSSQWLASPTPSGESSRALLPTSPLLGDHSDFSLTYMTKTFTQPPDGDNLLLGLGSSLLYTHDHLFALLVYWLSYYEFQNWTKITIPRSFVVVSAMFGFFLSAWYVFRIAFRPDFGFL